MSKLILLLLLIFIFNVVLPTLSSIPSPTPSPTPSPYFSNSVNYYFISEKVQIEINFYNIPHILILSLVSIIMFSLSYLQLCNHVRYGTFNTNLSICSMKKIIFILPQYTWMCLSLIMLGLLLNGCEEYQILLFTFNHSPYVGSLVELVLNSSKLLSWTISGILSIYTFSIAITPVAHILCLMIFQTW